jgi:hypothetical protein
LTETQLLNLKKEEKWRGGAFVKRDVEVVLGEQ